MDAVALPLMKAGCLYPSPVGAANRISYICVCGDRIHRRGGLRRLLLSLLLWFCTHFTEYFEGEFKKKK